MAGAGPDQLLSHSDGLAAALNKVTVGRVRGEEETVGESRPSDLLPGKGGT